MPEPLAICLEDLDPASPDDRYVRCTALVGRGPGLRIDTLGAVTWEQDRGTACELWVSLDDRLILFRPAGAETVRVHRAGRNLEVPEEKPVVIVDQDGVEVAGKRLQVHVHGVAPQVAPPTPLRTQARNAAAGVAAAVALSAALTGCCGPVEIREEPPSVAIPEEPADDDSAQTTPEPPTEAVTPEIPPIEVREEPPAVALPEEAQPVPELEEG